MCGTDTQTHCFVVYESCTEFAFPSHKFKLDGIYRSVADFKCLLILTNQLLENANCKKKKKRKKLKIVFL